MQTNQLAQTAQTKPHLNTSDQLLNQTDTLNAKPSKAGADLFSASSQNKARVQNLREQIFQRVRQSRSA